MSTTPTQVRPGMTSYGTIEGGPRFLSDVIIELGLAQEEHVNRAVQDARLSRANVGQILVQEGRLTEDDLARALAARYGLSHIDMTEFEVDPDAANLLPPNVAQRYRAVPLAFEPDGSLLVAMADPSDSLALSDITFMTHLDVQASVAAATVIEELAARLPLAPRESGGAGLPVTAPEAPAPAPEAPAEPVAEAAVAEPAPDPVPAVEVDTAELDRLRAELEEANSWLGEASAARDEANATLDEANAALETARSEVETADSELATARSELEVMRAERDAERDAARDELDVARGERDAALGEREVAVGERDARCRRARHCAVGARGCPWRR